MVVEGSVEDPDCLLTFAASRKRHRQHVAEARIGWGEFHGLLQTLDGSGGLSGAHLPQAQGVMRGSTLRVARERRPDGAFGSGLVALCALQVGQVEVRFGQAGLNAERRSERGSGFVDLTACELESAPFDVRSCLRCAHVEALLELAESTLERGPLSDRQLIEAHVSE